MKKRGFTLIELLVVIAVIAVLMGILMPALSLAREKAKNLSCRANIRSLGTGLRLYTESNDGRLFRKQDGLWLNHIAGQLGNVEQSRYCPSTKKRRSMDRSVNMVVGGARDPWVLNFGVPEPEQGSYALNGYFYSEFGGAMDKEEWDRSKWNNAFSTTGGNPAFIPVFIDASWVDLWPQDDDTVSAKFDLDREIGDLGSNGSGRNHMLRCMINRHGGRLSVSFLDGHVAPVHLRDMWSLKWSRAFKTDSEEHFREDGSIIHK